MTSVSIETTQNVTLNYELASVGDRILEGLIDVIVVAAYYIGAFIILGTLMPVKWSFEDLSTIIIYVLILLPVVFYSLLTELFFNGQTFGKMAVKTKVIKLDGSQPGLGEYVLRWFFRIIDLWTFGGVFGLISIISTQKAQRLGDLMAGTTVVKINRRINLSDTILTHHEVNYTPIFHQVTLLNDEQASLIKEVLKAYFLDNNYEVVDALAQKLKTILEITTEMPPLEFLNTLLQDYAYLTDQLSLSQRRY